MSWPKAVVGLAVAFFATALWANVSELEAVRGLASRGRTYEALDRLEPVLAKNPDDFESTLLKGVLLTELGRSAEAKSVFLDLTQRQPGRPEPYNNLAGLYGADGDYEQAIEVLKLALRTHPSYETVYENLTKVYGKLASEAYDRALGHETRGRAEPIELDLLTQAPPLVPPAGSEVGEGPPVARGAVPAPRSQEPIVREKVIPAAPPTPAATAAIGQGRPTAAEPPRDAEQPAEAVATAPPVEPAAESAAPQDSVLLAATAAVESWAQAWSRQDVEAYLSLYADEFVPPDGRSRSAWEAERRDRLGAPRFIQVTIAILDVGRTPSSVDVRFIQSYNSDRFSDTVTKTLEMVERDGAWKIRAETVEKG